MDNYFKMQIPAISQNEAFARNAVSAFALTLSPTIEEINDVKTAVSEAVTNCVVHAYDDFGAISIISEIHDNVLFVTISDNGKGIEDIDKAREPMYTSGGDERSGMGFTIMETFMDTVEIVSAPGQGTTITMSKSFKSC
ncbi:MAG: anti-sigma F factor [Clostridia bacterium]|nr:anti-sigma F factor [Clostridia bacterium]